MTGRRVVGYGTLLHRASLGHTIGHEVAAERELIPVWVSGYRRLYNFAPAHYKPSAKLGDSGIERSAANVEPADGRSFNGLAFEATEREIEKLDKRERGYDRVSASLRHFETGEPLGDGFIYVFHSDSELIVNTPGLLLPRWLDIRYARSGAYSVGDAFGRAFDETTFLADGATPVLDVFAPLSDEMMKP